MTSQEPRSPEGRDPTGRERGGWRALSNPRPSRAEIVARFEPSAFTRLARTHALMAAGDAVIAVALAGSLFFDIDPKGARTKVALYLLLTVAPFSIVAPLVGPAIDRMVGGRRLTVVLAAIGRTLVSLLMIMHLKSLLLFPEAFLALVLSKTYAVSKSALVPTVVTREEELVEANSKLGLLSGVAGFAATVPALLLRLIDARVTVGLAAVLFAAAIVAALQLPRDIVVANRRIEAEEVAELRSGGILLAASAMALLRATAGFLFFHVAFWFRVEKVSNVWFALVLICSALGTLAGNGLAPLLRRRIPEERMLIGALALTAVAGLVAAAASGKATAALLAAGIGFSAALGRLAFDSIVQRDAPAANSGRAFARFETRFQLAWVAAAFVPVIIHIPPAVGMLLIGLLAAFAVASYLAGARHLRQKGVLPERFSERAVREIRRRRRDQRASAPARPRPEPGGQPLPPPSPPSQS